jgi:sporulation protein YlmC with PRC-barrel domain
MQPYSYKGLAVAVLLLAGILLIGAAEHPEATGGADDALVNARWLVGKTVRYGDESLEVANLVVDPVTGAVAYMVVSSGGAPGLPGERHIVPLEKVAFPEAGPGDPEAWQEEQGMELVPKALPLGNRTAYEPRDPGCWSMQEASVYSRDMEVREVAAHARARDAGMVRGQDVGPDLLEIDSLEGREVRDARGRPAGELSGFLMDLETVRLALAVVRHDDVLGLGGGEYLVPYALVRVDEDRAVVRASREELERMARAGSLGWDGTALPRQRAQELCTALGLDGLEE